MSKLKVMKGDAFTEKRLRKWLKEDGAVVLQIKRDEFRCVVEVSNGPVPSVSYTSASGKPLYNLQCFDSQMVEMAHWYGTFRFDMGVCINDSFDLTRRTLRASTKPYDLSGKTWQVIPGKKKSDPAHFQGTLKACFWFYDLPDVSHAYISRRGDMALMHMNFPHHTAVPETEIVSVRADLTDGIDKAVQQVNEVFAQARLLGHEGIMVKRYDHKWEPKRCPDSWMKLKPSDEVDGIIIGKTEGKGKFYGLIGSLVCQAEDGSTFTISGMTDAERVTFTQHFDLYLGQWVTATYMERDTLGGYRHPQFNRMHAEKNL